MFSLCPLVTMLSPTRFCLANDSSSSSSSPPLRRKWNNTVKRTDVTYSTFITLRHLSLSLSLSLSLDQKSHFFKGFCPYLGFRQVGRYVTNHFQFQNLVWSSCWVAWPRRHTPVLWYCPHAVKPLGSGAHCKEMGVVLARWWVWSHSRRGGFGQVLYVVGKFLLIGRDLSVLYLHFIWFPHAV